MILHEMYIATMFGENEVSHVFVERAKFNVWFGTSPISITESNVSLEHSAK